VEAPTFSVSELTTAVRRLVQTGFPSQVWVEGDIGSISRTATGNVFFELVEHAGSGASVVGRLHVVLWDDVRREVNEVLRRGGAVRMSEGVRIRIRGWLDVFPGSGRVQLRMTGIDPDHTVGRMAAARAALVRVLEAEGLVGRNASVPLAPLPLEVGLVTRIGSAAHADVVHELAAAALGFRVRVVDVPVQGAGAERAVVAALGRLAAERVDVVIVARGGGARTDLLAFDAEVVARAIAASPVPVLTGIGHEIDTTVADVVAHGAHKTPTACAAAVVERARLAVRHLDHLATAVARVAPAVLDRRAALAADRARHTSRLAVAHLDRAAATTGARADRTARGGGRRVLAAERSLAATSAAAAAMAGHQLRTAGRHHDRRVVALTRRAQGPATTAEARLEVLAARVGALDPARALARGWSVTRTAQGTLVRSPADVPPGTVLHTTTAGGTLISTTDESTPEAGREGDR
jgi:exodeoxyribonuclease VII large subunit